MNRILLRKFIEAFSDARCYFHGKTHWSYKEKALRESFVSTSPGTLKTGYTLTEQCCCSIFKSFKQISSRSFLRKRVSSYLLKAKTIILDPDEHGYKLWFINSLFLV